MIRINLVAGERRAEKAAGKSFQIGQKITVLGSLIVLATVLLIGWRYWALNEREAQLTRDIEAAQREELRLAEVLKQVALFETQGAQLQERVKLIDELRRGQAAPVHILDQISRALPDMMWLTEIRQEGYVITIEGNCTSLTALSDFVGNLEGTRFFRRPVDIVSTAVQTGPPGAPELIEFTIKGTFQMSGIEQAPPGLPKAGKVG